MNALKACGEIKIRPISINKCFKGRRFKTKDYKDWRDLFAILIGKKKETVVGMVDIDLKFYIKNYKMADVDNMCKPCLDALVDSKVIEDDRFVKRITLEKFPVKREIDEKIQITIKRI